MTTRTVNNLKWSLMNIWLGRVAIGSPVVKKKRRPMFTHGKILLHNLNQTGILITKAIGPLRDHFQNQSNLGSTLRKQERMAT